jgi:hypothetical protein
MLVDRMLEYYERDTDEIPAPTETPPPAWLSKLERVVASGVLLYRYISHLDAQWAVDFTAQNAESMKCEHPSEIRPLYVWWLRPCDTVLDRVRAAKQRGFDVAFAEELRKSYLQAKTKTAWNLDHVEESANELEGGGGRPMRDVLNDIRRNHVE